MIIFDRCMMSVIIVRRLTRGPFSHIDFIAEQSRFFSRLLVPNVIFIVKIEIIATSTNFNGCIDNVTKNLYRLKRLR